MAVIPIVLIALGLAMDAFPHTTKDGLFLPGNIYFDGSYLWVAEAKFSDRLLRFTIAEQE